MSNTQQGSTSNNNRNNVNQTNGENEPRDSVNNIPLHKNIEEHNEKSDTHTRTGYGRIV